MNLIIAVLYGLIVIGNGVIFLAQLVRKGWLHICVLMAKLTQQKQVRQFVSGTKRVAQYVLVIIKHLLVLLLIVPQKLIHIAEKILTYIIFFLLFVGISIHLGIQKIRTKLALSFKKRHYKRRKHTNRFRILSKIKYFFFGVLFRSIFFFTPLLCLVFLQQLPNPTVLKTVQLPQTTKIYDRNHTLLYEMYANQNRTIINLSDIPLYLREATIAIEDKNFYQNPGVDVAAIVRAAIADISGDDLQGGSTITQQLIKSSLLTPERSITRKVEEIILAVWAEKLYTKDQ